MKGKLLLVFSFLFSFFLCAQDLSIGILIDQRQESSDQLLEDLKKEINGVLGPSYNISYKPLLFASRDLSTAQNNLRERLQDDTDIIITFGALNSIAVYNSGEAVKPIISFASISKDLIELEEGQTTSGRNNVTYVITPHSYISDLDAFASLYDYKTVGIIIDDFTSSILPVRNVFDQYFNDKDSTYEIIELNEDGNLNDSLEGIDAVFIAGGFGLSDDQFANLVSLINTKKLPSFSGVSRRDVERGILASQQPEADIPLFFRRIALNLESIVNGTNASELNMFLDYEPAMSINFNTASQIDFPLRYSMLGTTDFLGSPGETVLPEFSYSITDLMNRVVDNNLILRASEKNIDLASQDLKTSKSNYLPNLTAGASGLYIDPDVAEIAGGVSPEFSTSGNLTLQQLIYSESATAGIDIQKNILKAQEADFNSQELDAILDASVAYFNALILKTNAQIQNQNLQLTKANLRIAEQNFEAGSTGKGDVLRFKSQLAQNVQAVIDADNNLKQAFFLINQLVNDPIDTKIGVADAEINAGLFERYGYDDFKNTLDNPKIRNYVIDFLIEEAKKNAPELKSIGYSLDVNERTYRLNNGGRYVPIVSLQGQYNLAISESGAGSTIPAGVPTVPDGTYNVGVNLSLPLFQQNQRNINKQSALIQGEQLRLQQDNLNLNIERNVNELVLNLVREIANIEISKVSEDAARESLELIQNQYRNGAVPVIQLIDAQNNFLQSQLARATANYNYLITSLQLERAIGFFFLMNSEAAYQEFQQRANQFILSRQ